MVKHYRTFYTVLLLIVLSSLIVVLLYTYILNTSLKTVQEDIKANNLNRLHQLITSVDYNVDNLRSLAIALEINPNILLLSSVDLMDKYEQIQLRRDIVDMLRLQGYSQGWDNRISIYSHYFEEWIGTTYYQQAPQLVEKSLSWNYDPTDKQFSTFRPGNDFTIRISFPQKNLEDIIKNAKIDNNDPFFLDKDSSKIINYKSDKGFLNEIMTTLSPLLREREQGTEIVTIGENEYMIMFMRSKTLGWYLVNYLPLDVVLKPITQTMRIFYATCFLFFIGSLITTIYVYRKIQVPIITMVKGVQAIKVGDYSYRIKSVSHNEFDMLYKNFNEMGEEIENLVERVYKEKVISREAMIKKLQAQINPHFLYNCLFFINNMNRLRNDEAVEAMIQNLATYFRYSTRLDEPTTTMEKEIAVVEIYLTIQQLRMERLKFGIHIPESMKSLQIPKLLIQPLVENSMVHGIQNKQLSGFIRITGERSDQMYRIIVEDDGKGMSEEEIHKLLKKIKQPLDDTMGCALWNIQQRMSIHFEQPAGMEIKRSSLGGLYVTLFWPNSERKGDNSHVPTNDC
jgi:two-component system, sensor histidine kinase YesM